jgi:YD repeat-containing protein
MDNRYWILGARYWVLVAGIMLSGAVYAQEPTAAQIKAKKIKKLTKQYSGDASLSPEVYIYYYDENGNDTALYMNGARYSYKTISYDKSGRRITEERFFASGSKMDKTIFTYNADGSFTSLNTDSQYGLKITEAYDKKGNLLYNTIPDGTVIKYSYNAKGQKLSMFSVPIKGEKKFAVTYAYGSDGKMISSSQKDPVTKTTYEYGANGLFKKETIVRPTRTNGNNKSVVEYIFE